MNIIEGNYKAKDGKDYFSAVIFQNKKKIQIYKNFSCNAAISSYLTKLGVSSMFKIEFLGDSIDLSKISKKYSKFEII